MSVGRYDDLAAQTGLTKVARWSTWDQDPWQVGDSYGVSVHRK